MVKNKNSQELLLFYGRRYILVVYEDKIRFIMLPLDVDMKIFQ